MSSGLVATASTTINAPASAVWHALVTPDSIREYMFGTTVVSSWTEGSPIVWKGEWKGRAYEDKGIIRRLQPDRVFEYSHFSPLAGIPDVPENYHIVTIEMSRDGANTRVTLSQDNNATEQERQNSEKYWGMMLAGLKALVERAP
jgi:uncharacterized protein YndB with AHSA1/START domain